MDRQQRFRPHSLTFLALPHVTQVWRINQLLRASETFRRVTISEKDVLVPFVIIFSLNVIMLLLMTLLDPMRWQRVNKNENESFGTCWRSGGTTQIVLFALIVAVNLSAVVLANIQAFRARGMSDEYSESRYIGFALGGMLQVFMVGVPVLFLVEESPPAFFLVASSTVFLVSISLLLLIAVPKLLLVHKSGSDNHPRIRRSTVYSGVSAAASRDSFKAPPTNPYHQKQLDAYKARVMAMKVRMVSAGINVDSFFEELDKEQISIPSVPPPRALSVNDSHPESPGV